MLEMPIGIANLQLTVDALLVGGGLVLLRLVPIDDHTITERQCGTCIGSTNCRQRLECLMQKARTLHRSSTKNEQVWSQCDEQPRSIDSQSSMTTPCLICYKYLKLFLGLELAGSLWNR